MKKIYFIYILFLLNCFACQDDPEFEITQNILFLVGDAGEGKTWKLVKAEIPLETNGSAQTIIYDILNQPEFSCYKDDNFTFMLDDSLHINSGTTICDNLFYETASASWEISEESSPDPSILMISRAKGDVTEKYDFPLNQINKEMIISQINLPVNEPIEIQLDDVSATIYELDLTLFFESVDTLNNGK
ncbi:hypothetical protein [Chondrinema litorale]|uniref:hypothetical protein n=1 Tax=Chondrinema litorale TaxID=2994555 RepID=UPI00254378C7|nr:hypothetical protein [Chondrinema litorale]UZR93535.1 hypothetical protein OQ292_16920 [Chondrinema litorale]